MNPRPAALFVAALIVGCKDRPTAPAADPASALTPAGPWRVVQPVPIATYEGSGQAIHPDVVVLPESWSGPAWQLALTPFPAGDARYEDPSVYASVDGKQWTARGANPVARPATFGAVLYSDPALVYAPELAELRLYFRSYRLVQDSDVIWLMRSGDGVSWTPAARVFATAFSQALSPTVVHRAPGEWTMWTVAGRCVDGQTRLERRTSTDGVTWSAPDSQDLGGLMPWHVFVRWVPELLRYVLLTNVKPSPLSCTTTTLRLAASADGLTWAVGVRPWLTAGEDSLHLFPDILYRSAFAVVGDSVRFWYSGAARTVRTYPCERGQTLCSDTVTHWGHLGTEIRSVAELDHALSP